MNTSKSALILVDLENDFLSENGALHAAVKDSLQINNTISNLNQAIEAARQKGMKIIFTSMSFSENYHEMGANPYGILAAVKDANALKRGDWGSEVAENISFDKGDTVIQKNTMCAFKQTQLKQILEQHQIETLVFAGLVTDLCLETSVRSAYDLSYEVISLVDCMASLNQTAHENTVKENFPLFSKPITQKEFVSALNNA